MGSDLDNSSTCERAGDQALATAAERVNAALDVFVDVLEDVQKVISGGRPKTLKVRLGEKTLAEFPVALTAAAAVAAGIAAVLLTKLAIELEHED